MLNFIFFLIAEGCTVEGPLFIDSDWNYAKGVKGYE